MDLRSYQSYFLQSIFCRRSSAGSEKRLLAQDKWNHCTCIKLFPSNFGNDITYTLVKATSDNNISKGADLASPTCHGNGLFFGPAPKISTYIGRPEKTPSIPEVALVDFTPDRRQWISGAALCKNFQEILIISTYPRSVPFEAIVWGLWCPKSRVFWISWESHFSRDCEILQNYNFTTYEMLILAFKSAVWMWKVPHFQENLALLDEFSMYCYMYIMTKNC